MNTEKANPRIRSLMIIIMMIAALLMVGEAGIRCAGVQHQYAAGRTALSFASTNPADGGSFGWGRDREHLNHRHWRFPRHFQVSVLPRQRVFVDALCIPPTPFEIPTDKFVDGLYNLSVQAYMRDGFITPVTAINVTFANGNTTPPINTNTFSAPHRARQRPASPTSWPLPAMGPAASGRR